MLDGEISFWLKRLNESDYDGRYSGGYKGRWDDRCYLLLLISLGGWIGPGVLAFLSMMGKGKTMGLAVMFDGSTDRFFIGGTFARGAYSRTPQLIVKNYSFYFWALFIPWAWTFLFSDSYYWIPCFYSSIVTNENK